MNVPSYPAAKIVASKVRQYVLNYQPLAEKGCELAPFPDEDVIESLVEVAFWTSLRREEQYPPRISLSYVCPEQSSSTVLQLKKALPLQPNALTRIAPGVERPNIHLATWLFDGELRVWGAVRSLPRFSIIVETVAPGHLVIKCKQSEGSGKFVNIAVLEGDQVKFLDHTMEKPPGNTPLLDSLLGKSSVSATAKDTSNALVKLSLSMRDHKKGGILLIVPKDDDTWRSSIAHPISYEISPTYKELSSAYREEPIEGRERHWRDAVTRAVDAVAGLTAIDGATIMNEDYEVLAFGAKIIRRQGASPLEYVTLAEPIENAKQTVIPVGQLGGTRHISGALFAYDQKGSIALVASQDGPFTMFTWSEEKKTLFAQRVDTLLI